MAGYKQPCIHCGTFIESDARICIGCGRLNPFGFQCPSCNHPIQKNQAVCSGCGRSLYVPCPVCGKATFVQEWCEYCNSNLMVYCENKRCGAIQFFQNEKCTACGKKMKKRIGGK